MSKDSLEVLLYIKFHPYPQTHPSEIRILTHILHFTHLFLTFCDEPFHNKKLNRFNRENSCNHYPNSTISILLFVLSHSSTNPIFATLRIYICYKNWLILYLLFYLSLFTLNIIYKYYVNTDRCTFSSFFSEAHRIPIYEFWLIRKYLLSVLYIPNNIPTLRICQRTILMKISVFSYLSCINCILG